MRSAATTSFASPTRTPGPKFGSRTKAGCASTASRPSRPSAWRSVSVVRRRRRPQSPDGVAHGSVGAQTALLLGRRRTRAGRRGSIGYGPELQRALLESLGFDNLRRAQRSAVLLGLAVAATVALLLGLELVLVVAATAARGRSTPRRSASPHSCGDLKRLAGAGARAERRPARVRRARSQARCRTRRRGFAASSSSICARATSRTRTARRWRRSQPRSRRFAPRAPEPRHG